MAQSKFQPLYALACLAVLGACSSSGGGSHHTSPSHHGGSGTSATKPQAVKITGNYLHLPYDDKEIQAKFKTGDIDVNGELDTLRIGQQVIPLYPNNRGRFVELKGDNVKVLIGKHLENARYGWVGQTKGLYSDSMYFFAQGKPSPALSAGKFSYTGYSVFSHKDLEAVVTGTSRFDVDFGSKKLTGTISAGQYSVPVFANIQSNGNFAGEKDGVVSKGAFYGKDAAELAGTFYQKKNNNQFGDFIGAFGAGNKTAK